MDFFGFLRKRIRRWLGIAAIQRQVRDLEEAMAISSADLERLNAATTRIAARVKSLLDQIDALGTGNDDEVRAAAQQEAIQQASENLRPVIEQLELLGADAGDVVPEPAPEQVPVEPGPDVAPVENLPEADAPAPDAPASETAPEDVPVDPAAEPAVEAPAEEGTVVPADEVPAAGGDTAGSDETAR